MKNFYITLLFLGLSLAVSGQTILNKTETTRTVQDLYTIILAPIFNVKGAATIPFVAKIGASTELPPPSPSSSTAGATNPSGENVSTANGSIFHDTKGDIQVGSSGQLNYTLPIALPPGINSVAPQMNLMYTSGSGNGIAGFGWSLSGITNIARIGKNIEKDGVLKGIDLTLNDIYVFNGTRLLLKSGQYGKNGAEYVTEKFSNTKIKSVGDISNPNFQGPESWEVTFEDGSQAWYGANATSRTQIEYNITKWKDAQGNYITYNYTQTDNVASISSIHWGGSGNETLPKPHFNSIEFEYIARTSKEIAYSNGLAFTQNNLLKSILVKANGNQFKKYVVDYKNDVNSPQYQYVDKLTEYNSQNQAANPLVFNYEQTSNSAWKSQPFVDTDDKKITGDFDGDGTLDYLAYSAAYSECTAYQTITRTITDDEVYSTEVTENVCISSIQRPAGINLFSSFFSSNSSLKQLVTGTILPFSKEELQSAIPISFVKNNNQVSTKQGLLIKKENYNNSTTLSDIILEIYAIEDGVLQLVKTKTIPAALYDDVSSQRFPPLGEGDPNDPYHQETSRIDVRGVSKLDPNSDGIDEVLVYLTRTSTFVQNITDPNYLPAPTISYQNSELIIDLNSELTPSNSISKISFNSHYAGTFNIDLNGDGKQEKLILGISNTTQLLQEFFKDVNNKYTINYRSITTNIKGLKHKALTGDFNGDGKTDLMVPFAEGSKDWNMYISNGTDFIEYAYPNFSSYKTYNYYQSGGSLSEYARDNHYHRQYVLQDINQDGKSDFIEFSSHSRQNTKRSNNFSQYIINTYENKGFDSTSNKYVFQKKNIDNHSEVVEVLKSQNGQPIVTTYKNYDTYPFSYVDSGIKYTSSAAAFASVGTPHEINPFSVMVGNFDINNSNNQIIVQIKGSIRTFSHAKVGVKVNSINQGGITTDIVYSELVPTKNPGFYAPVKVEQYPFVESDKLSQTFAVSQLKQNGKQQDFKYRGFISHMTGRGNDWV